jgi:hypothetical protein
MSPSVSNHTALVGTFLVSSQQVTSKLKDETCRNKPHDNLTDSVIILELSVDVNNSIVLNNLYYVGVIICLGDNLLCYHLAG